MQDARFLDRPRAWLWWIIASTIGFAFGFALWQSAFPAIRLVLPTLLGGILLVAGFGATTGFCAGLAQALTLRWGLAQASVWVLADMFGAAVGFVVAAKITGLLNAVLEPRISLPLTDAVLVLTFGGVVGAAIGLSQWLILRSRGNSAPRWILASTVGLLIGYPLAIGVLELLPSLDQPWVGVAFGLCAGAATALIQWPIVRGQSGVRGRAN